MAKLEYSIDALNTRGAFLGVSETIYVEGEDDEIFWDKIFSKFLNFNYSIESLGGSVELDKYIEKIKNNGLKAIVARDADYLRFCGELSDCPRVIYTRGYSIENTLYDEKSIFELVRNWCKISTLKDSACNEWLSSFSSSFKKLLAMDVVNCKHGLGLQVLYDSCECYMVGRNSSIPCENKIHEKINSLREHMDDVSVEEVFSEIGNDPNKVFLLIRGHFFASGVAKFICSQAANRKKKLNVSNDGLYAAAMSYFSGGFNESHRDYEYYRLAVLGVMNA